MVGFPHLFVNVYGRVSHIGLPIDVAPALLGWPNFHSGVTAGGISELSDVKSQNCYGGFPWLCPNSWMVLKNHLTSALLGGYPQKTSIILVLKSMVTSVWGSTIL